MQVDAEAYAGALQVDKFTLVVRQPKTKAAERDGAPDADHVVLWGVRFHNMPDALLADNLGDDVIGRLGGVIDPACRAATVDVPTLTLMVEIWKCLPQMNRASRAKSPVFCKRRRICKIIDDKQNLPELLILSCFKEVLVIFAAG